MPRGIAREEPIGIWKIGATASERVQGARRWAAHLFHSEASLPPFHGCEGDLAKDHA